MDILDELDAAINEKRSKWNYTPMREKNETDALIDELLLEFSSDSNEDETIHSDSRSAEKNTSNLQTDKPKKRTGTKKTRLYLEKDQLRTEKVQNYAKKISESLSDEHQENAVHENFSENKKRARIKPTEIVPPDDDTEELNEEDIPEKVDLPQYRDENEYDGGEYDENDNADEYEDEFDDDEYDDDEFEEYARDYPDGTEKNEYWGNDFNSFMDFSNDGEKGDIPSFSVSVIFKILLKILALAIFGTFAVVGIINTADIGIKKLDELKGNSANSADDMKQKLQSVIYPLIVTETEDFEKPEDLSSKQLVNIAIWEIVINGDISVFKTEISDEYIVPDNQIEYAVNKLFGEKIKIKHTDSEINGMEITYDKKNKQYIIPNNTDLYTFHPIVTDLADTGSAYTLYADCYNTLPSWNSEKSAPAKRVMVNMSKTGDYYNIVSLKTVPTE